jgi:hypothetical protein
MLDVLKVDAWETALFSAAPGALLAAFAAAAA